MGRYSTELYTSTIFYYDDVTHKKTCADKPAAIAKHATPICQLEEEYVWVHTVRSVHNYNLFYDDVTHQRPT